MAAVRCAGRDRVTGGFAGRAQCLQDFGRLVRTALLTHDLQRPADSNAGSPPSLGCLRVVPGLDLPPGMEPYEIVAGVPAAGLVEELNVHKAVEQVVRPILTEAEERRGGPERDLRSARRAAGTISWTGLQAEQPVPT
jgi:hypothetical protein